MRIPWRRKQFLGEIPGGTTLSRYARITMMVPRDFAKSLQTPCRGNNAPFPYLNQNNVVYDITNISSFFYVFRLRCSLVSVKVIIMHTTNQHEKFGRKPENSGFDSLQSWARVRFKPELFCNCTSCFVTASITFTEAHSLSHKCCNATGI